MKSAACLLATLLTVASFSATVKAQNMCSLCNSTTTIFFSVDSWTDLTFEDGAEAIGASCGMAANATSIYDQTQFSVPYNSTDLTATFVNGTTVTCTPDVKITYLNDIINCCI